MKITVKDIIAEFLRDDLPSENFFPTMLNIHKKAGHLHNTKAVYAQQSLKAPAAEDDHPGI